MYFEEEIYLVYLIDKLLVLEEIYKKLEEKFKRLFNEIEWVIEVKINKWELYECF